MLDGVLETILDNGDCGHSRGNSVDSVDSRSNNMGGVVDNRGSDLNSGGLNLNRLDLNGSRGSNSGMQTSIAEVGGSIAKVTSIRGSEVTVGKVCRISGRGAQGRSHNS